MLIREWLQEHRRFELHEDAFIYHDLRYAQQKRYSIAEFWEQEAYQFFTHQEVTELFCWMRHIPLPETANAWARQSWLFWTSIDLDRLLPLQTDFQHFLNKQNRRFTLDKTGAALGQKSDFYYAFAPLHRFYFRSLGSGDLPVELRQRAWQELERCFKTDAAALQQQRCILIDYTKIVRRNWKIEYGPEMYEELEISTSYITVSERWGRDGGGFAIRFEDFWYNPGGVGLSKWNDKITDLQDSIRKAIVSDQPGAAPALSD